MSSPACSPPAAREVDPLEKQEQIGPLQLDVGGIPGGPSEPTDGETLVQNRVPGPVPPEQFHGGPLSSDEHEHVAFERLTAELGAHHPGEGVERLS